MEKYVWFEPITLEKTRLEPQLKIRGIAIKAGMSRNYNIYLEEELKAAVKSLIGKPIYLEHVDVANAIGKITNAWWDDKEKAIWYEAEIYDDEIANKIRAGLIQHVSIAADYEVLEPVNGKIPHGLKFRELSLVAVPGIPETNIQVVERLFEKMNANLPNYQEIYAHRLMEEVEKMENQVKEKVVKHDMDYVKAPEDTPWSFTAEEGNEILKKYGWRGYRNCHAWYDPEKADTKAGYKLPHHKIVDGKFAVVWRGVVAAMAALMGARGGVDIPASDRRGVYNHLAKHYEEFGREPPAYETAKLEFQLGDLNEKLEALTDELGRISNKVNYIMENLLPKRKIKVKF